MKRTRKAALLLALIMIFTALLPTLSLADGSSDVSDAVADNPGITSGNAVVAYCIDDDQFLYADRIDESVAPTVATKLVACMVVSDILKERNLKSDDVNVTVTQTAIDNSGDIADVRVPMMALKVGSIYSAKDLLSATLVACANDAVSALACHFGEIYLNGGITEFVDRMNAKAESLGLTRTHFVNPTGLDAPNQTSTPREVALIAAAFYRYDELVKLSDVESFFFNGSATVRNKNYLKSNYTIDGFLNKSAVGLIAGQLNKSGNYCLLTATQKEGRTYIYVVMCATGMIVTRDENDNYHYSFGEGNAYVDMNKLIEWTQKSFSFLSVATTEDIVGELRVNAGGSSYVRVVPGENVERLVLDIDGIEPDMQLVYDTSVVFKKEFNGVEYDTVDAPVSAGMKVGTIVYSYNGIELATVDAVVKDNVDSDGLKSALDSVKGFMEGPLLKLLYILLGIVGLWLVYSVVMAVIRGVQRARKRQGGDNGTKGKSPKAPKKPKSDGKDKKVKPDPKSSTREIR